MPFSLPEPDRKNRLQQIQRLLSQHKSESDIKALANSVSIMLREPSFRKYVARSRQLQKPVTDEASLMAMAWSFLYHLLYADDFVAAAMILWDDETFCA